MARVAVGFATPYEAEVAEFRAKAGAYWQLATSRSVVWAALRISLVVGTLLNLLNLGPSLARGIDGTILLRLLGNYFVPYCVATFGAVSQAARRDDAP